MLMIVYTWEGTNSEGVGSIVYFFLFLSITLKIKNKFGLYF